MVIETDINHSYSLLKRIIATADGQKSAADLSRVEKLIFTELPEVLGDSAPANFPQLYFDFKHEYERFKEFIMYDKLIGRNIVALGGGFSSGKSSFLNSILGTNILPQDINPSTSVPAYLVKGDEESVYGINTFGGNVSMVLSDVAAISHGFGKTEDDPVEATLGHILESIFICSENQPFEHIALLDTPGYSKAESDSYSSKTDEKIARVQLNSSNYILWFVQAGGGTITENDIAFLNSLNKDIPKLIIVNKADQVVPEDLPTIIEKIKDILTVKGIPFVDVLAYSMRKKFPYDKEKILERLAKWDEQVYESRFAYNFKVLFTKCKEYYDDCIDGENKRLNRLNKALTLSDNDTVTECLTSLTSEIKRSISLLKERKANLTKLQNDFFTEMKTIGDAVNIQMPEPSEIDLIRDKIVNPKDVLDEYIKKNGVKKNNDINIILSETFADFKPAFNKAYGNAEYKKELMCVIEDNITILKSKVKLNDCITAASQLATVVENNLV